jgi:7-cyano-7-deazaguanine synthase
MDSSTLLYQLKYEDFKVTALSVDYGQRHRRELEAADEVAAAAGVELVYADFERALGPIFQGAKSSQVGAFEDVPHGHYAAENMKTTIVPNRNMLLLSIAGAFAESRGAGTVAYAAHSGDHAIYPDCRPTFVDAMRNAFREASWNPIEIYTPFVNITKTDIAARGHALRVPLELTYSCYRGEDLHCGRCGTCVERIEAFRDAGLDDPTRYETVSA